ncbi:Far10 protein [Saccharomycopsis crataegensis]|uniref:Far10 protein n=1 Tax=Saccharomycopsis crataegensis TaxID=43959 RepID=A0AAV5QN29_9ASCO|nr:Far10 protein [Saccharomycopsis crataegensis]
MSSSSTSHLPSPDSSSVDSFFQTLNNSDDSSSASSTASLGKLDKQPSNQHQQSLLLPPNQQQPFSMQPPGHSQSSITKHNRKRSNSKSRRQLNTLPPSSPSSFQNNTTATTAKSAKIDRSQLQYTVVLTSLNGTFEKKSLVIPYHPDVLKLGRPAGTKIQPTSTNGYFDSRVLSRNHAQLFADINTGKIYLKDLGSSNGTFVNDEKIASDKDAQPTEIKKGDVIDLGFDIESHQNHRKISAKVENILIRALTSSSMVANIVNNDDNSNDASSIHLFEIEDDVKNSILSNSFDCALFGDILPGFEDNLLNIKNDSMTGLSINSNLTTSSNLDFQIKTLINEIYLMKNSILKSKTIEVFLKKYIKNLKKIEIEKNEANRNKVKDYEQQLVKTYEKDFTEKKMEFDKKFFKLSEINKSIKSENEKLVSVITELNEKASNFEKFLKEEKAKVVEITAENDSFKNQIETQSHELNDYKIRITDLEAKLQEHNKKSYREKSIRTDPIKRYPKHSNTGSLNDNDSDSSTLNDDDINLQRLSKVLNARNGADNYPSNLKNTIATGEGSDKEVDGDAKETLQIEETKTNIPSSSSDEDLNENMRDDRSNIITDDSISETSEPEELQHYDENDESPFPSPRAATNDYVSIGDRLMGSGNAVEPHEIDGRTADDKGVVSQIDTNNNITKYDDHEQNRLAENFEKLRSENDEIKGLLQSKDEKIQFLKAQLAEMTMNESSKLQRKQLQSRQEHPVSSWVLDRRDEPLMLSRSASNISINSACSSSATGVSLAPSQSPLFGIFGPSFPLRSRNGLASGSAGSAIDLEDSLMDIDVEDDQHLRQSMNHSPSVSSLSTGSAKLLKTETAKQSIVTAVGIVFIGLMVSRFSSGAV